MKGISKINKKMEKASSTSKMEDFMMGSGKTIKCTATDISTTKVVKWLMKVNGRRTNLMEEERCTMIDHNNSHSRSISMTLQL